MVIPQGHAGRLTYLSDFLEEAKVSGLLQQTIERAGLRGVQVAPLGNPRARQQAKGARGSTPCST